MAFIPNYLWKNSKFVNHYQLKVDNAIKHLDFNSNNAIDELHSALRTCASEACIDFNQSTYTFQSKPWWNDEIRKAHNNLRYMFNNWRDEGFPKHQSSTSFHRYRFARKIFRYHVRRAKNNATVEHYINTDKLKNIKPQSYWKNLRLLKNKDQKLFTINGKTKKTDITNEFHNHFDNLLNTPRIAHIDNDESNMKLRELLAQIESKFSNNFNVSESEVTKALDKLKFGKSRDPFQINAEHFLCAKNTTFITYLTGLVNKLFISPKLPHQLSTSILIPLVKSYKKSMNDANNYRGISLIPTLTKLLELIVLVKCPEVGDHALSQFGFAPGSSTLHAELLISDTIKHYNSRGSPVYICSLDAEKAFDCCNWNTLFSKLTKKNIPNEIVALLIKLYLNGTAVVHYASHQSPKPFALTQGVRQGGILSPFLYNIYTEDLLQHIKSLEIGTYLPNNLHTAIIAYADDIILLSPTLSHLQTMIDQCISHGINNCLKYNQSKTQFTVSGNYLQNPYIRINDTIIYASMTPLSVNKMN